MHSPDETLWRDCAAWLTRCKIIPANHSATKNKSDIKVLALTLRDGVLLCNLIHFLDPTMEPKEFNQRPKDAQFLCLQNIRTFLECCRVNFEIGSADLFDEMMLYDMTHFEKVLNTLSKLSMCRKAQINHPRNSGFKVQPLQPEQSTASANIYKNLYINIATSKHNEGAAYQSESEDDTKDEAIYQELCSVRKSMEKHKESSTMKKNEKHNSAIEELVGTEAKYCEVLEALKFTFMTPMERLVKDDVKIIFPRITELVDIHEEFLRKLTDAVDSSSSSTISSVFIEFREKFLIYGDYCSKMATATEKLDKVCKHDLAVAHLVEECQAAYKEGKFMLRDVLIMPFQRVLKYNLLLKEISKRTATSHPDSQGLKRAKEVMADVSGCINAIKHDSDHLSVIKKVSESIIDFNFPNGNELWQYGRLLLDGELSVKAHNSQEHKLRYAFVFEKIMILVKNDESNTAERHYTFREAYNLADYHVDNDSAKKALGRDARFKFQLQVTKKSKEAAFTLFMKTEAERESWMKAIINAIDALEPPGCKSTDHKFTIMTFEKPTDCNHCKKFLKGLVHQGYKCRDCGIGVHKGCISSSGRCRHVPRPMPSHIDFSEFNWYVGQMDRDAATLKLESKPTGTFLLRCRPQGAADTKETMYALSVKTSNNVKHMKILQRITNKETHFFLSTRRYFESIADLISFYEKHDLGENFAGLSQSLMYTFYESTPNSYVNLGTRESSINHTRNGASRRY